MSKVRRYSYSQLTQIDDCPYSYYLNKIDRHEGLSNIFAEIGSLSHDILDEWGKGKFEDNDEMAEEFLERFPLEVVSPPPAVMKPGWVDNQKNTMEEFFRNFDQFPGYKILATEQQFEIEVAGRPFVGIVDMICEEVDTGALVIFDHKSKKADDLKKHAKEMYRQQYLYAKFVEEQYGKFPDKLAFHLFKAGGARFEIPFDIKEYEATLKWAEKQMEKIESFTIMDWMETKPQPTTKDGREAEDYFCVNICSFRNICPNGIPLRKR